MISFGRTKASLPALMGSHTGLIYFHVDLYHEIQQSVGTEGDELLA